MAAQPIPIRRDAVGSTDVTPSAIVGTLLGLDEQGAALVQYRGAPRSSMLARVASCDSALSDRETCRGLQVLLTFENGNTELPLIVGVVRDRIAQSPIVTRENSLTHVGALAQTVEVNGKRLVFEGQEEIVFRCGQGSITLRADGAIVVKGTRLLSRASEVNKIRGASVQIN